MNHRYMHLEALRGLSALAVVEGHYHLFPGLKLTGLFAVDLFFVMSGFVIAHAYGEKLRRGMTFFDFVRIRLIRLYPMYLLAHFEGIAILYFVYGGFQSRWAMGLGLFMLPDPTSATDLYPIILVAWSLAYEIIINLVYGLTVRYWTTRNIAVFSVFSAAALFFCTNFYGSYNFGWWWPNSPGGLAKIFFCFPLGVLIYNLREAGFSWPRAPSWLILLAPFVLLWNWDIGRATFALQTLIEFVFIPALVILAVGGEPPARLWKVCGILGIVSYPAYLLHVAIIQPTSALLLASQGVDRYIASMLVLAGFTWLCWAVDQYADAPLRRFLLRVSAPRRASAAPTAAGANG